MFLQTIGESRSNRPSCRIYTRLRNRSFWALYMATARSFTARPDFLPDLLPDFFEKLRSGFSLGVREWRLITLIAAKRIPSTYCSYVYGKQLIGDLGSKDAVLAVQRDFRTAGLPEKDVEMLAYAEKIAKDAVPG